jgi:hypothetical protein
MIDGASGDAQHDPIVGAPADYSLEWPRSDRACALDRSVRGHAGAATQMGRPVA